MSHNYYRNIFEESHAQLHTDYGLYVQRLESLRFRCIDCTYTMHYTIVSIIY